MKITKGFLKNWNACKAGADWVWAQKTDDAEKLVHLLIVYNDKWANWLIVRCLDNKNRVHYAIYAAEQVIRIFEKKYPNDKRIKAAIDAAKKVLKRNTKGNRAAADAAACAAAYAAADAAADDAACAAAYAAYAAVDAAADDAADAAYAAARAADAAARAADAAAYAAADAAAYARAAMKKKIILHGIKLLKKTGKN